MNTQSIGKRSKLSLAGIVLGAVAVGAVLLTGCGGDEGGGGGNGGGDNPAGGGSSKYILTVKSDPPNSGSFDQKPEGAQFNKGESVTVTVRPRVSGKYTFLGWDGASTSKNDSVTIVMDGNKTLTAKFLEKFAITAVADPVEGGTISLKPDSAFYPKGTKVTLTALWTPDSVYDFIGWAVKDSIIGRDFLLSCTVNSDTTITAKFKTRYQILVTKDGNGDVTFDPPGPYYDDGTEVTITASPTTDFMAWRNPDNSFYQNQNVAQNPVLKIIINKANVELTAKFSN